jgi:hypothetical protein
MACLSLQALTISDPLKAGLVVTNGRARTTLGDLQRSSPWVWLNCEKCEHYAPPACAVPVIRWGPHTSSDNSYSRHTIGGCFVPGLRRRANETA